MDFLNKALAQLTDLFRSMTPGARITSGLLLVMIAISGGYLVNQRIVGPDAFLLGGQSFSTEELRAMEAAFGKKGLGGYDVDGGRIRVPQYQKHEYMAALAEDNALPKNFGQLLEQAIQESGPFSSSKLTKERLLIAKQQGVAMMLQGIDWIDRALVVYDEKENPGLFEEDLASASVRVDAKGNAPLSSERAETIRQAVAKSFAGLKLENISVLDGAGRYYSPMDGPDGMASGGRQFFEATKREEDALRRKVLDLVSIPNVLVSVHAELSDALTKTTQATEFQDAQKIASRSSQLESASFGGADGGRVGLQAQQQGANAAATLQAANEPRSKTTEIDEESRSVLPGTITRTEFAGLTLKDAKVTVSIPRSFYTKVWSAQPGNEGKQPTAANLADIENSQKASIQLAIDNILPQRPPGEDTLPRVRVDTYEDLPPEEIPGPSFAEEALAWLKASWTSIGMMGLAMFSLLILRSALKMPAVAPKVPATAQTTAAGGEAAPSGGEEKPTADESPTVKLKRITGSGPNLRAQLAELVKEDPDAAATILKNWIGSAA